MGNDRKTNFRMELATAHSRLSKRWINKDWAWDTFVERCSDMRETDETAAEYARMSRDEQSNIKDVGGFVGGYLSGGTRKTGNVIYRTMATLDIDFGTENVWDDFTLAFDCAALIYSTHKHSKENPRYRLVIPFNRHVTPTEYEPICRRIAAEIGIDLFDHTTYELARLFYWPSRSKGAPFLADHQDGAPLDVDKILSTYKDYRDVSQWPMASKESDIIRHDMRIAGDPTEKPGLIGAFCRSYTIEEAIDKFLGDQYDPTAMEGRYTYKLGSVAGGLVCYDGKFAFSHHDTDPASRRLCNAFDLVRIHLFGVRDEKSRTEDVTRLPSYTLMQEFAAKDPNVRITMTREKQSEVDDDFKDVDIEDETASSSEWMGGIDYAMNNKPKSTSKNIIYILEHDPKLAGHLWHDMFSGFDMVKDGLPWDKKATQWGNRDDANLRVYLDKNYEITGKDKIKDAKDAVLTQHRIHPVREYLGGLVWDGVERLDRLVIDYLGAEDTPLNRAMTRKHFAAAVTRIYRPGCKYDYCLILAGAEGIGKSTLFSVMGGSWFNDSLSTTEGKEGMEQLRRAWLIEMAELSSIKRSTVEQVKNYISRTDDIYRAAYGQVVENHPRQCVFCGSTNEDFFLKGDTGNRRFWVIRVNEKLRRFKNYIEELKKDRDQLWAEAVQRFKEKEPLYLPYELEREARARQAEFNDDSDDPTVNMVRTFLDIRLPVDWKTWELNRRRAFFRNPDPLEAVGVDQRTEMCIPEFLCEYMGLDMSDKDYKYRARKIGAIMDRESGWDRMSTVYHAKALYGQQRGFRRKTRKSGEDDDEL